MNDPTKFSFGVDSDVYKSYVVHNVWYFNAKKEVFFFRLPEWRGEWKLRGHECDLTANRVNWHTLSAQFKLVFHWHVGANTIDQVTFLSFYKSPPKHGLLSKSFHTTSAGMSKRFDIYDTSHEVYTRLLTLNYYWKYMNCGCVHYERIVRIRSDRSNTRPAKNFKPEHRERDHMIWVLSSVTANLGLPAIHHIIP